MYYRRSFPTRNSAKHAVIEFIEAYYTAAGPTRRSATRCRPRLWKSSSNARRQSP